MPNNLQFIDDNSQPPCMFLRCISDWPFVLSCLVLSRLVLTRLVSSCLAVQSSSLASTVDSILANASDLAAHRFSIQQLYSSSTCMLSWCCASRGARCQITQLMCYARRSCCPKPRSRHRPSSIRSWRMRLHWMSMPCHHCSDSVYSSQNKVQAATAFIHSFSANLSPLSTMTSHFISSSHWYACYYAPERQTD
jgi:hypothetical protein